MRGDTEHQPGNKQTPLGYASLIEIVVAILYRFCPLVPIALLVLFLRFVPRYLLFTGDLPPPSLCPVLPDAIAIAFTITITRKRKRETLRILVRIGER